jgi:hypothetical protein
LYWEFLFETVVEILFLFPQCESSMFLIRP